MRFRLERVRFIPKALEPGVLYVSEEFDIAVHLCACGCGTTINTPLGPTEWSVTETATGPSLDPSIGNWQEACESHYWIEGGKVRWAPKWTPQQIAAGRRAEEERREAYYETLYRRRGGLIRRFWCWLKRKLLGQSS
ncbi:MAG: hypothetical protein L0387_37565 [Acidobacteria bacterium]|nr:hypothetical protein [Acidobacteriota bacterium]